MILVDAGPLIAAFDSSDGHHLECARLLQDAPEELLVPQPVIAEVCYMIGRARFGALGRSAIPEELRGRQPVDGRVGTVVLPTNG